MIYIYIYAHIVYYIEKLISIMYYLQRSLSLKLFYRMITRTVGLCNRPRDQWLISGQADLETVFFSFDIFDTKKY